MQINIAYFISYLYVILIYLYTLLVRLFVCLNLINVKTPELIRPKFLVGPHKVKLSEFQAAPT